MPLTVTIPDVPVTDFRQVRAGAYWHWNSLARAATNRKLFNGDFSSLVDGRSKTARNGLALISDNGDFNPTNWFKSITRFYIDALLAERPGLQSDAEARALFMAENAEKVWQAVESEMEERSWGGHFTLTVTVARDVEAAPSYAYVPVYGNAAQATPTGHILSYRYAAGSETAVRAAVAPMADRVDITKWANGSGVVETYPLSGDNTLRGEPTIAPSNITHIWHFGDGCDDYTAIASLVSEGMVLQTLMGYGIHRHLEPQFTGPGRGARAADPAQPGTVRALSGPWRLPAY